MPSETKLSVMKVQILEQKDNSMKFLLEGVKPSFASALRRIMISEIPTMAVEYIDFKRNDSALADELLANRIGMVPLTFDEKSYKLPTDEERKGEKEGKNVVKLVLKKKGPGQVLSGDFKSSDDSVKPLYDNIPVTELFTEDESVDLEATAMLGLGKDHAKWQGAVVGYKLSEGKQDSFIFNVESICGIPVDQLVERSADILSEKLDELGKEVKKLK